jgi:hypothetical protein
MDRFANFMEGIRRLRAVGYKITDSEAYDLFMRTEARRIADG